MQFRAIVPLFLAASLFVHAQEVPQATQPVGDPAGRAAVANPALRTELLEMMREDQAVRMMGGTPENAGEETNAEDAERTIGDGPLARLFESASRGIRMRRVDARNTARIREIISAHGWPGASMVGNDGALAAFLLVQHADSDPGFQRRCLELMTAAPPGEVSPSHVAYLTDRVLVNERKPQRYGTQFWTVNGELEPRPIEDEANVDQRRAEVGLEPMDAYRRRLMSGE